MAGANGPTSAAGTPDAPNPLGGAGADEAGRHAKPEAGVAVEQPSGGKADGAPPEGDAQGEGGQT